MMMIILLLNELSKMLSGYFEIRFYSKSLIFFCMNMPLKYRVCSRFFGGKLHIMAKKKF